MPQIRGIILDMDGTLIDSNDAHARSWVLAMQGAGFEPGYAKVRRLIGIGGDFLIPEALGIEAGSETGKRISNRRKEIFGIRGRTGCAAGQGRVIQRVGYPPRKAGQPPGSESLEAVW